MEHRVDVACRIVKVLLANKERIHLDQEARVEPLSEISLSLAHEVTNEDDRGSGAIPERAHRCACVYESCRMIMMRTHPVMSSCATAVRPIMTAVGFWICISRNSTLPSLVSLRSVGGDDA